MVVDVGFSCRGVAARVIAVIRERYSVRSRLRARRRQRGAAIFVVMAVLLVLTAAGIFASHNAALNQRLSGYSKQATQASYIADLGTMAAVDELSNGSASAYMELVMAGEEQCQANYYVEESFLPCYRLTKTDIETRILAETGHEGSLVDSASLGSRLSPLDAEFVVEMTDPGPAGRPVAGMNQSDVGPRFRYMQVTISGLGQIRPRDATSEEVSSVAAVRGNRAVVQVGPLPW